MNIFKKQKWNHRHREQICGCYGGGVGERWTGSLGLADKNYYIQKIDKQQGPTVQHRELYSVSCDKP